MVYEPRQLEFWMPEKALRKEKMKSYTFGIFTGAGAMFTALWVYGWYLGY